MSTSFSVASWTDVMTSSVEGLMTSKVLPSTALTNSLLMKLWSEFAISVCGVVLGVGGD
jgi:hypothetical protein